jgi:hypothetical protein
MAFFWALEPWAVRLPEAQLPAAADAPAVDAVELLSEPHALSANVAVKAIPAMMPDRWSFTVFPSSGSHLRAP